MTRTKPLHLFMLAVAGAAILWFIETALATSGRPVLIPPFTVAVALVLIGIIIVAMAWPVRRVARGDRSKRVDPFYATRVVVLAKASSLAGALLAGGALGILGFFLTRSVPQVSSVTMAIAVVVGAVLLLVGGLVAEHWCTIPPDDDEKTRKGTPDPQGL